jgi:dipeptidase E
MAVASIVGESYRNPVPVYAIDDQTAVKVVDDTVEVVSEGHWKLFTP